MLPTLNTFLSHGYSTPNKETLAINTFHNNIIQLNQNTKLNTARGIKIYTPAQEKNVANIYNNTIIKNQTLHQKT